MDRFGWGTGAASFSRPFLSHAELEVVLDKPSELHDQLNAVARIGGTQRRGQAPGRPAQSRGGGRQVGDRRSSGFSRPSCLAARTRGPARLSGSSRPENWTSTPSEFSRPERAAPPDGDLQILAALRAIRVPHPGDVEALEGRLGDAAARSGADPAPPPRAWLPVRPELLAAAVAHFDVHGPGDCPVCGRAGALDHEWLAATRVQIERLRAEAAEMDSAQVEAREVAAAVIRMLAPAPAVLSQAGVVGIDPAAAEMGGRRGRRSRSSPWRRWRRAGRPEHFTDTYGPLAEAVSELAGAASAEYERRQDTWSPVAARLARWCADERAAATARETVKEIKKAEAWLKDANHHLRNERLRPYVDGASHIWEQLRQESNVDRGASPWRGRGPGGKSSSISAWTGTEAPALPVLSQGELHALALRCSCPGDLPEAAPSVSWLSTTPSSPWTPPRSTAWRGRWTKWRPTGR